MNSWGVLVAAVVTVLSLPSSHAEENGRSYEREVRCDKDALHYYDEVEQPKNIANNVLFYESFIESHFNTEESKCIAHISAMTRKYRGNTAEWSDILMDVDSQVVFGTLKKVVDLRSSAIDDFQCSIRGETCASKAEFKARVKEFMEN